jgi:hypothetical protein
MLSNTVFIHFREWYLLRNLPKISVMEGSPLRRKGAAHNDLSDETVAKFIVPYWRIKSTMA